MGTSARQKETNARPDLQHNDAGDFFGRKSEVEELRRLASAAESGNGRIVLVEGEAGIGKTRLLKQFAAFRENEGAQLFWGRCSEDASAPAFWPWLQMIRSFQKGSPEDTPVKTTQFEFLRDPTSTTMTQTKVGSIADYSAVERFRLFDRISNSLCAASMDRSITLLIDDLHLADSASLSLVEFLAGDVAHSHILLVCRYRGEELQLKPRFEQTVLASVRGANTTQIALTGLKKRDVARLAAHHCGDDLDADVVDMLHRRTDGNPFFVVEMCRLAGRHFKKGWPRRLEPTPTIRALIRRRLSRVSEPCRQVLDAAAILGREFSSNVLAEIVSESAADLEPCLDEAVRHSLIRDDGTPLRRYRFSHALVRDTLYLEIPRRTRDALHSLAVAALEKLSDFSSENRLDVLAHHSFLAAGSIGYEKALQYSVRAGRSALASFAYEKAEAHFQHCLEILPESSNQKDKCELYLLLGEAQTKAGSGPAAKETFKTAFAIARRICSPRHLAEAAIGTKGMTRGTLPPDWSVISSLQEALTVTSADDAHTRARILTALSTAVFFAKPDSMYSTLADEAIDLASKVGDDAILGDAIEAKLISVFRYDRIPEVLSLAKRLRDLGERSQSHDLIFRARIFEYAGHTQVRDSQARTDLDVCVELAERLRHPRYLWQVYLARASLALSRGDLKGAKDLQEQTRLLGSRFHDPTSLQHLVLFQFMEMRFRHDADKLIPLVEAVIASAPDYLLPRVGLALIYTTSGQNPQARFTLAPVIADGLSCIVPDAFGLVMMCLLAETLCFLELADLASDLAKRMEPYSEQLAIAGWGSSLEGAVAHFIGLLHTTFASPCKGEALLRKAVAINQAADLRLFAARSQAALASCLSLQGKNSAARQNLDEATAVYGSAGLQLPLLPPRLKQHSRPLSESREISHPFDQPKPVEPDSVDGGEVITGTLCKEGEYWTLRYQKRVIRLRNRKGIQQLALLLANPEVEIPAQALSRLGSTGRYCDESAEIALGSSGEITDQQALFQYASRSRELQADLDEADAKNDLGAVERIKSELEWLRRAISNAMGIGKRTRLAGSAAERARVSVRNNLSAVFRTVKESDRTVGLHLEQSIRTGHSCVYRPSQRVEWVIEGSSTGRIGHKSG